MQKRISPRAPALTAGLFAVAFALDPGGLLAASDCLDQPSRVPGQSGHWYYHLDRASGRKCWYLAGSEPAPTPSQTEVPPPQGAPEPPRQPPPLSSFFSSLTSGFTTASTGGSQPDAPDVRAMSPTQRAPSDGDDAAPKRRKHADAKSARQPASLDQADRDALFQQYLRWKERQ